MKKDIFAIMAMIWGLVACDIKAPVRVGYEPPPDQVEERDSTIFGMCGRGSTANRLILFTVNDDTLTFNLEEARRNKRVLGGYAPNEELYVLASADSTTAYMVVSKNRLLGEWVMPSPFDGSTPSGIVIKDGGEAESFEQQGDIIYKSWRIVNGRLQLVETRDDGTELEYTQDFEIVRMTDDLLYIRNDEESYEYGRYHPEPVEDLGIELDYNYEEDYSLF